MEGDHRKDDINRHFGQTAVHFGDHGELTIIKFIPKSDTTTLKYVHPLINDKLSYLPIFLIIYTLTIRERKGRKSKKKNVNDHRRR